MNRYEKRVYQMFKRRGLAEKYEHPGIYSISIDDTLVYIGKSENMLIRVAQHYVGIKTESERKYRILAEAWRKGHSITFNVLYYAEEHGYHAIEEEIGWKEGEYIRKYLPPLNHQIPKEDNWRLFTKNKLSQSITLSDIAQNIKENLS